MKTIDLLELKPSTVSKDIKDYDMLLYGESGIGKSEFALDLYGRDKCLALAFEDSYTGIGGAYAVNIDKYATLKSYLIQLERPEVRAKYDVVIIDTLYLLDYCIEKSITDAYGVELLGDALKYNKAYKIVDKKFLEVVKRIQKMGYTIVYVGHSVNKVQKIGGVDVTKLEPKVSDRIKNLLLPEVDMHLFCYTDAEGNRKIATQKSQYWDARNRVSDMSPLIDFDASVFREEFLKGLEKKHKSEEIIEKREQVYEETRTFEEMMEYLTKDLAVKCGDVGKLEDANRIIVSTLGRDNDGNYRTLADATPQMTGALEVIITELEILLGIK